MLPPVVGRQHHIAPPPSPQTRVIVRRYAISSGTAAGFARLRMPTNVAKHIVHVEISVTLRDHGSGWLRIAHCWRSAQILGAAPPSQRNPTLGSYPPPSWLSLPPHKSYSVRWLHCPAPLLVAPQLVAQWLVALRLVAPQALLVPLHWC